MDRDTHPQTAGPATPGGVPGGPTKTPISVREKTLRHMRELLAKAALAGGTLQLACCPPIVCDPLPPPVDCAAGLTADQIASLLTTQGDWMQGSDGLVGNVWLSLDAWNARFSGQPVLEGADLVCSESSRGMLLTRCETGPIVCDPLPPPLCGTDPTAGLPATARFTFSPSAGVIAVRASLIVTCDDGASTTLHLTLDVSGTPLEGGEIPVTVEG